jgi:hypothetical protein
MKIIEFVINYIMFRLAFSAAVLTSAVCATHTALADSDSLAILASEDSLFDFEPVELAEGLVKGFKNKNTYTYTFMEGTSV